MEPPDPVDIVLHCFDPQGREIVDQLGRWENHIETRHPDVDEHFESVQAALERPEIIMIDAVHAERRNYYRRGALPPPYHPFYLKVCVGFYPSGLPGILAEVITAHQATNIGSGETQEWP